MRLPRLTFTSYRDPKGYKIEGRVPEQPRSKLPRRPPQFLQLMTCGRLGKPEGSGPWISGYIVRTSDKMEAVQLDRYPAAYTEFAAVETPTQLLEFIWKYGPLTKAKRQVIFTLLAEARQLRDCMGAKKGVARLANIVGLEASLIRNETGTLEAYLTPSSLLDALWLQFQHSQSSGADYRRCLACNNLFAVGGNSPRRKFAKFCSDEHRKRFNSLARSDPKMRQKRK